MEWIICKERLPTPLIPVLVYIPQYEVRTRAMYTPARMLEQHPDVEGGIYDEATDTFWADEGWYEYNIFEEINWKIPVEVSHWMPLPEPPL